MIYTTKLILFEEGRLDDLCQTVCREILSSPLLKSHTGFKFFFKQGKCNTYVLKRTQKPSPEFVALMVRFALNDPSFPIKKIGVKYEGQDSAFVEPDPDELINFKRYLRKIYKKIIYSDTHPCPKIDSFYIGDEISTKQ